MNNRDMFYNSYGYQSNIPFQMMPKMIDTNMANQMNYPNIYNPINDINNRITKLEDKINKLNQRLTRLETANNNIYNNEPDSNLYML